jgi:Phage integrase family
LYLIVVSREELITWLLDPAQSDICRDQLRIDPSIPPELEPALKRAQEAAEGGQNRRSRLNSVAGRPKVPNIESRCNQLKLGHPPEEAWSVMKDRAVAARGRYAFPSPESPDMPIGSVRKAHDAAVRRARIKPRFRLYDLRHTYASRAAMAGVDLPTLAALLGHTSIQMTMRYVHPAEEHKREAVGKLENFKIAEAMRLAEKSQPVSTISTTLRMMN